MAGLLEEDDKSIVGKLYDGLLGGLSFYRENYIPSQEVANEIVDLIPSGLSKLGYEPRPTTTEADFFQSLDNTLYNLPSQVAPLAKGTLEAVYNPIETGTGLLRLLDGANTNLGDVFYDTITPEKYEAAFKEFRTRGASEQSIENEAMASAVGNMAVEMLSTEQGRRELFQQHGLEGLIALTFLPKNILKLPKIAQQQALAEFFQNGSNPLATSTNIMPGANLLDMVTPKPLGFMIGEKGAVRLGKTDKLNKAKEMHSKGVDADTIWKETGFAKGQDGGWRMEIDDSNASLKDITEPMDTNLVIRGDQRLNHPELMKAYPELADIDVKPYVFNLQGGAFGYYARDAGNPTIGFNPAAKKSLEEYSASPKAKAYSSLGKTLHEFQHGAQDIENNAGGSSPRAEQSRILQADGSVDKARDDINKIKKRLEDTSLTKDERVLLTKRQQVLEEEIVNLERQAAIKGDDNYRNRVLGELEAFQTQGDVALTAAERANRLPNYLRNKDVLLRGDPESLGVDSGLLGETAPLMKSSNFKRRNDGTYVGFSKSVDTPQKLNKLITQIDRMATEGADARMWYEDSSKQILNLVNGDKVEAEKLAQIIAITSQGASVATNTSFAFKAYSQYKAGMPIETGRFPAAQSKKIVDVLNGIPWEGRKTNSFYENLMIEIDPSKVTANTTTQDLWMARAFGLDSEVPGSGQYEVMEKIVQSIATKNGWRPHQAQSSVWVAVKARNDAMKSFINATVKEKGWGNNANDIFPENQRKFDKFYQTTVYDSEYNLDEFLKASYSFADGIEDNLGYINLEAVPGTTTDFLPGIKNAKPEEVAAYTKDMYSVFLDENGVDMLAKEIGIVSPGNFLGFGGWKGEINPNVQVRGILSGTQASGINKADIDLVETYAAVVGTLFKQDGVSYRRAFADKKVANQNAVDLDIGRQLTKEENERLYAQLTKQIGNDFISPTSSATGADIINYTLFEDSVPTIKNADFKKLVKQAIIDADLGEVELGYYRSDGDLLQNNWKENRNGEQYKNRKNATSKSQEVYRRVVNQYSQEVNKVNQRYKRDYGW